jgi:RNA polymerase sigma-70 factor (ECF subfamily)
VFARETVEKLLCHLIRFGSSRPDAEDLAQESLLIAWRDRAKFDATRPLDAWLYGIARNVYRNLTKQQRRRPVDPSGDPGNEGAAQTPALGDILTLQRALQQLPENQLDIVILHELEGHTLKETAELLVIPFDTAKDRLRRARGILETTCGVALDGAISAERTETRRTAKLAAVPVLAVVLAVIGRSGTATATTITMKLALAATLIGGLIAGIVIDRTVLHSTPTSRITSAVVPYASAAPSPSDATPSDAAPIDASHVRAMRSARSPSTRVYSRAGSSRTSAISSSSRPALRSASSTACVRASTRFARHIPPACTASDWTSSRRSSHVDRWHRVLGDGRAGGALPARDKELLRHRGICRRRWLRHCGLCVADAALLQRGLQGLHLEGDYALTVERDVGVRRRHLATTDTALRHSGYRSCRWHLI